MKRFSSAVPWLLALAVCGGAALWAFTAARPQQEQAKLVTLPLSSELVKRDEVKGIVRYFLYKHMGSNLTGYRLHRIEETFDEAANRTTFRLVFGEPEARGTSGIAKSVYAAFGGIYTALNERALLLGENEVLLFLCREDGSPLTFQWWEHRDIPVWSLPTDIPFTGMRDDFLRRQALVPRRLNAEPASSRLFHSLSPLRDDAAAQEIDRFLTSSFHLSGQSFLAYPDFSAPAGADPALVLELAMGLAVEYDMEACLALPPEECNTLFPILGVWNHGCVLEADVDSAARQVFGETVTVAHGNTLTGGWYYHEESAAYTLDKSYTSSHLYELVPLEYRRAGDTVTVQAAGVYLPLYGGGQAQAYRDGGYPVEFELDENGAPLDAAALRRFLVNEAARMEFTLTKKPDGGFWLTGFRNLSPFSS